MFACLLVCLPTFHSILVIFFRYNSRQRGNKASSWLNNVRNIGSKFVRYSSLTFVTAWTFPEKSIKEKKICEKFLFYFLEESLTLFFSLYFYCFPLLFIRMMDGCMFRNVSKPTSPLSHLIAILSLLQVHTGGRWCR